MASPGGFTCFLLLAAVPGTRKCQSKEALIQQTEDTLQEIQEFVVESTAINKTFFTKYEEVLGNLRTNGARDLANLNLTANNLIASIKSDVDRLVAEAGDTDVTKCTNLFNPSISRATEIVEDATDCINEVVERSVIDRSSFERLQPELNTLTELRDEALVCLARFGKYREKDFDTLRAYGCLESIGRASRRSYSELAFLEDVNLDITFYGYGRDVAKCIEDSSGKLESRVSYSQNVLERVSSCVTKTIGSK